MKNLVFYIKNFSYCNETDEIIKTLPMLLRRKLSSLDKLALSSILKVFDKNVEEIVFSSQYGEFERLFSIIEQYKKENTVSPVQFSASVHNYLLGVLAIHKKMTCGYSALSSFENSLSMGLIKAVIANKNVLYCYSDTYKENKSVSCVISKEKEGALFKVAFKKEINENLKEDEYKSFIEFLEEKQNTFKTPIGVFQRL